MAESKLLSFYRGGPDDRGRRLSDMLRWDHQQLESTHDFIQWLFPLREPSLANPAAPVLSEDDTAAFRRDPGLRQRMRDALGAMMWFLGLEPAGPHPWLRPGNHNYLRLTRMLRSLRTAGLEFEAQQLFTQLTSIYREHGTAIGPTTYGYWQRAMSEEL